MKQRNYQQTLDYLYRQLPMFQRVGKQAFKKDLSNTLALCQALGNPEKSFPAIHVAGTNGKGSTVHLLSAALQAQGLRVGVYTSPHYRDFRERIKINGQLMQRSFVVDFVRNQEALLESVRPSFFEITVVMAFAYFAQQKVDIALIETGLGGRLDSTNVIQPLVSVITNISFDHQEFLGTTLPQIAGEKAGIIKAQTPVVIGRRQAETESVFLQKAAAMDAPIHFAEDKWKASLLDSDHDTSTFEISKENKTLIPRLKVEISGPYQAENVATALATLEVLSSLFSNYSFDLASIREGWARLKQLTYYLGRWQVLAKAPLTLADSAHNPAGLELVINRLQELSYRKMHVVVGMVKDKEPEKLLEKFPQAADYYFARPNIPRGLDAEKLRQAAAPFHLKGKTYTSVRRALAAARRRAELTDLIFVGGSTFVVAEVV